MLWTGCKDKDGYGFVTISRKLYRVHRYVYSLIHGELSRKIMVCHSCDTPSCINPEHLWGGTGSQNQQDAARKNRRGVSKLKVEDVKKIRELVASGAAVRSVASKFSISGHQVYGIANGKYWSYI